MASNLDISKLAEMHCVDEVTTIASHAAEAILRFDPAAASRRFKSDGSPVTAADEAANAIIIEELSRLLPNVPIVSEESALSKGASSALTSCFALVDPLDGTREFLASRNEFTVNIALLVDGAPLVGVIIAPARALVWRGVATRGAERFCLSPGANVSEATQRIPLNTRRRLPEDGLVAAVSRSHFDSRTAAMLSLLQVDNETSCGSSIKFCRIAEGSVDIYPRLAPTHEWDIAAGHAIVAAAGGVVIAPDGNPLVYGRADNEFIVPAFIALGNPAMSRVILAITASG